MEQDTTAIPNLDLEYLKTLPKETLNNLKRWIGEIMASEDEVENMEQLTLDDDQIQESPPKRTKKTKKSKKSRPTMAEMVKFCLANQMPTSITPHQDVIGYKTVSIRDKRKGITYGEACLQMRIPFAEASVYNSNRNNQVLQPSLLEKGIKYSTSRAFVENATLRCNTPGNLKLALIALQTKNAEFVSNWTSTFKYPLKKYVNEPRAGSCKGIECGPGIYFFIDRPNTYQYSKANLTWVVSNVINNTLELQALEDSPETPGDEEEAEQAKERRIAELREWAEKSVGSEQFQIQQ